MLRHNLGYPLTILNISHIRNNGTHYNMVSVTHNRSKCKSIPVQAYSGQEGSRRLRLCL